ncbi:MAG TPA: hypothetical protein VET45_05965 [Candidatus Binatia bacterium]|nr:hypothetical protein [Candidatus Binatia bacterium]
MRFKPGDDHDDRNLKIGSGGFHPFGGSQKMGVDAEKDARGYYKLTPKQPLESGEYGIVLTLGSAAGASSKVYDFGVD